MKQRLVLLVCALITLQGVWADAITTYKLTNGLTIYLWEDHNQPDVFGSVVVRAGAVDEPLTNTGLAHYLEHLMFKGTQTIGALDWEKEKPLYEEIIALYERYYASTDPAEQASLETAINERSLEAAKYGQTNEFSNLTQRLGGQDLNAGTGYDQTMYFSRFPTFEMQKWLELNAERFVNPVFRAFQAEMENVFEEYNMYQDDNSEHIQNFVFQHLYKGHPYERNIIGDPAHLKKPRLQALIDYYQSWYVPNNMALILVGNFESGKAKSMIRKAFGRLENKPLPPRLAFPDTDFTGNPRYKAKLGYQPSVTWGYKAVPVASEDALLLEFCASLLSNGMNTGLLDKLTMDGDVMYAAASMDARRDRGRFLIQAVPYYDAGQRLYESDKATEKVVMQAVDKLKSGDVDEWLIASVKNNLLRQRQLFLESSQGKFSTLAEIFIFQLPASYLVSVPERILAVTKADIQRVANQYLTGDHVTITIEEGTPKKEKLKKPAIKPLDPPEGSSVYAEAFKQLPADTLIPVYCGFDEVNKATLYEGVTLHHTNNPLNPFFSMTLRYGVGTTNMPKLAYAAAMMNAAGIMPSEDPQSVRRQLSELNASCTFSVTDDYLNINVVGDEAKLTEICNLVSRLILLPRIDDKQLNRVVGSALSQRLMVERKSSDYLADALLNYTLYKDKSDYIDRMKLMDIYHLKQAELAGEIVRATNYELDIHYAGQAPFEAIRETLKANLPIKEGVVKSESPLVKERETYTERTIFFLPNEDSQQAQLYFYFNGEPYTKAEAVAYKAFSEYFGGGFTGLVMQEVREKRSMAYTASGSFSLPPLPGKKALFLGYIGTQPDKAADAIDVYMSLLTDMPRYPERLEAIKVYMRQSYLSSRPSFRNRTQVFDAWRRMGYEDDPAKVNKAAIDALTFETIESFYEKYVKDKPVTIVIMGDPKLINLKQVQEKYGKVTRLNANRLFSSNEI